MGKTRAEVQKAYRERKKAKEGSDYLRKETERVKGYYKPTTELESRKLNKRREKIRNCMRRKRAISRDARTVVAAREQHEIANDDVQVPNIPPDHNTGPCDSTTNDICQPSVASSSTLQTGRLVVDLKFVKGRRGRPRQSNALKVANSALKTLKSQLGSLKKKHTALKRKLNRSRSTVSSGNRMSYVCVTPSNRKRKLNFEETKLTPKSKAEREVHNLGITPTKRRRIVEELTLSNTILTELKENVVEERGRSRQRTLLQNVCGKLMKKYRLQSRFSQAVSVNRKQVMMSRNRKDVKKRRLNNERLRIKGTVVRFLEREDNSACIPGKRDATKSKTTKIQNRVLNDYLYNLHLKFSAENPSIKLSRTTFASYRPSYIKLVHFSSRRTCLCQKHQNLSLKLKGLKAAGAITTDNPDFLIHSHTDDEILQKVTDCDTEAITFSEWKRKEVTYKGRTCKRMMLENTTLSKEMFIEMFRSDLSIFRKHVSRVTSQYDQMKLLKEKLPNNHAICQMDFAENYSCSHADEIQTAYFDKCSVTLHPVVVYTKDIEGTMEHISYIYVSDTQSHNSGTVFAFLKHITETLKTKRPDIDCIHYLTDSPTSQYRNKAMMHVIANHDALFGMTASWQYWEAGHGKGPCDGVGGASKRQADLAVKRHAAVIQSSMDYYKWGSSQTDSQTKYVFVSKDECDVAQQELSLLNIKPIKGTLDIHSVVQIKAGEIAVRSTSCFCDGCFKDGQFAITCPGWEKHSLQYKNGEPIVRNVSSGEDQSAPVSNSDTISAEPCTHSDETVAVNSFVSPQETEEFSVNDYVAAVYNRKWYIGLIKDYDPEDSNLPFQVSFMEHGKGKGCLTFKWPTKQDIVWVQRGDILCRIEEPQPHGTRKMYKLQSTDESKINQAFDMYK